MKKKSAMQQVGEKIRAERVVSEYIRAVGDEKTELEVVFSDADTGKQKLISKAEALARSIWQMAMECEDEKLKLEYRKLLLDRIEGRPGAVNETAPQPRRIPDKVSEKGKQRLNSMVGEDDESI